MKTPERNSDFYTSKPLLADESASMKEIRGIRNEHYEQTKDMTSEEREAFLEKKAEAFINRLKSPQYRLKAHLG